jgi:hypothetical protein
MWRACNDFLPTKTNLLRHSVVPNALCPICMRNVEIVKHILWSCHSAQDIWWAVQRRFKKVQMGVPLLFIFFKALVERCDVVDLELMVVVAWKMWLRRNGVVHGGEFTHPQQVFREVSISVGDFRGASTTYMATRGPIHEDPLLLW